MGFVNLFKEEVWIGGLKDFPIFPICGGHPERRWDSSVTEVDIVDDF